MLRRASAPWHDAVEQAFAGWDLQQRAGLARFLTAQARAVFALEAALEGAGVDGLCHGWTRRTRSALIRADLAMLGCPVPEAAPPPSLDTPGRSLGALYVLEGSRLGGRMLARQVRGSADPAVRAATRFLEGEPEAHAWATFRAVLDAAPVDRSHLVEGAQRAFACFVAAAQTAGQDDAGPPAEHALAPQAST